MKSMQLQNNKDIALLGAFCLFLSAVEYMIPKPLPFLRIGLANLPLMLALNVLPLPSFLVLVCIKILGQAIITGTLFSYIFLFSCAGTFCSALLMFALKRIFKQNISFVGISAAGAMVSCVAQVLLAYFFVFGESVRFITPVFLITGLITGIALGVIANNVKIIRKSNEEDAKKAKEETCSITVHNCAPSAVLFITGLLVMPLIVFNPSTELRVIIFFVLWGTAFLLKKKTNLLMVFLFIITIIAFNLIIPYGKVLYSLGPFKITIGALRAGIHRAVTFQSLVMLSKLTIREDLKLPGKFGNLLGESLRIFSSMMSRKPVFKNRKFVEIIEDMLNNAYNRR